jgi:iron complex transport system ATP-binding protein
VGFQVRAKGLSVGYGSKEVLSGVSLEVEKGKLTLVVGPNASGKSTLLKTLAGILRPLGGVVTIDGKEVYRMRSRERARSIGAVTTSRPQVSEMTVEEVVGMGRYPWTGPLHLLTARDREVVERAMRVTGVLHLRRRRISELSDGQLQRVLIARALAQEPDYLILDEPTTHLDAPSRIEVMTLLRDLAKGEGVGVIASTHELELALRFGDRIVLVSSGTVRVYSRPEDAVRDPEFVGAFSVGRSISLSPVTLSVEVLQRPRGDAPKAFVVSGSGTGPPVFRALVRRGYAVSAGVLHENDIDYHVAVSMGIDVVSERPYFPISEAAVREALERASESDVVVFTYPPIGPLNSGNLRLVEEALAMGMKVYGIGSARPYEIPGLRTVNSVEELPYGSERRISVAPTLPPWPRTRSIGSSPRSSSSSRDR